MIITLLRRHSIFIVLCIYFLVLMHHYWPNRGGSGFYLPGNMLGMAIFGCIILLTSLKVSSSLSYSTCSMWLIAGVGILLLPILWIDEDFFSNVQSRLLGLSVGVIAYFCLLQWRIDSSDRKRIIFLLFIACFIEGVLGLLQYFDFVNGTGYEVADHRPFGIFQQTNVMASFMATGLTLGVGIYASIKRLPIWITCLISISMIIFPFLLTVIGSRTGVLAAIILFPIQFRILWRSSRQGACRAAFLMLLGVSIGCFLDFWFPSRDMASMTTVNYRLLYWEVALKMLAVHPWIGWGYGHFQHDFLHYFYNQHPEVTESILLIHPHNEILLWAVEGGALGVIGCGVLIVSMLTILHRKLRLGIRLQLFQTPLLAAIPILLHMLVEYPLYLSAPHVFVLLLIIRVSDVRKKTIYFSTVNILVSRVIIFMIGFSLIVYMLNGMLVANIITRVEKNGLRNIKSFTSFLHPHPWEIRENYDLKLADLLNHKNRMDNITNYKNWGEEEIKVRPDATIYINLIKIYKLQGNNQRAYILMQEGHTIYPADERWNNFYPINN